MVVAYDWKTLSWRFGVWVCSEAPSDRDAMVDVVPQRFMDHLTQVGYDQVGGFKHLFYSKYLVSRLFSPPTRVTLVITRAGVLGPVATSVAKLAKLVTFCGSSGRRSSPAG